MGPGLTRQRRPVLHGGRATPITDLLEDATGGERLATWNQHRGHLGMDGKRHPGGEWDELRHLPLRLRKRLAGAGWLARNGLPPDELLVYVQARYAPAGSWGTGDLVDWYVRHARLAILERRAAHHHDRHHALARAHGHASYYEHRTALAHAAGYRSVWHMRRERGWD